MISDHYHLVKDLLLLSEVSIFLVARTEKQIDEQFSDDDYSQDTGDDFDDPIIKDFDEKK